MREAIPEYQRRTIHDVCDSVKLSYGICQRILLHEMNMRRIATKFVPRMLGSDHKAHRIAVCSELKEQTETNLTSSQPSLLVTNLILWIRP